MGLKTAAEYRQSLRDGRVVYLSGEQVEDVTTHPALKVGVDTAAFDYEMAEMPEYHDLAAVTDEKTREPISRYYYTPKNSDDLLKRHELMVTGTRANQGIVPFTKDIGADAMNAVSMTAQMMGKKEYMDRAENFRIYLQKNDLSMAGAMSDAKGNRVLRPSDPKQAHPDYYVRIVDKNRDGIVVRGAKLHITAAAYFNELLIMPCRNMSEADADYAVSFAIPANTKGITQIAHPFHYRRGDDDFPVDVPIRNHTDSMIIFDDVLVPWDRVFLAGEWQFVMPLVYNFATLHRHTGCSYHIPILEILVGAAQAIAEYNGIDRVPHIREQITDLAIELQTLKSLSKASCLDYEIYGGIPIPNRAITNIAKYRYANNWHNSTKLIQDIAGGLLVTAPTYRDWQNAKTRDYIDKYLGGKAGISTEDRLRMLQVIRYALSAESEVVAIHAEGSLAAQRMMILAEAMADIQECKQRVMDLAGTKGTPAAS
ncbi:MAG: 4-hydroxyphenylacetate 3-hydroxylase N-terminal domain-containing protein [Dehalococcoidia bacterium]